MVDPDTIVAIAKVVVSSFQELRGWISRLESRKTPLEPAELNALRALQTAVIRTSSYVGTLEAGGDSDRAQEKELANLWSDAAFAFYVVDKEVAPLLHLKADAWARPQQWIEEKVEEAGITLDEMNQLVTQILKGVRA